MDGRCADYVLVFGNPSSNVAEASDLGDVGQERLLLVVEPLIASRA
jgi:hypothetical protein